MLRTIRPTLKFRAAEIVERADFVCCDSSVGAVVVTVHCIALQRSAMGAPMQDQVTVRLPEDLSQALAATSRSMHKKRSEIVRLALREFLGAAAGSRTRPADRVRSLIGALESGVPDLAEEHRAYVVESLRRGR